MRESNLVVRSSPPAGLRPTDPVNSQSDQPVRSETSDDNLWHNPSLKSDYSSSFSILFDQSSPSLERMTTENSVNRDKEVIMGSHSTKITKRYSDSRMLAPCSPGKDKPSFTDESQISVVAKPYKSQKNTSLESTIDLEAENSIGDHSELYLDAVDDVGISAVTESFSVSLRLATPTPPVKPLTPSDNRSIVTFDSFDADSYMNDSQSADGIYSLPDFDASIKTSVWEHESKVDMLDLASLSEVIDLASENTFAKKRQPISSLKGGDSWVSSATSMPSTKRSPPRKRFDVPNAETLMARGKHLALPHGQEVLSGTSRNVHSEEEDESISTQYRIHNGIRGSMLSRSGTLPSCVPIGHFSGDVDDKVKLSTLSIQYLDSGALISDAVPEERKMQPIKENLQIAKKNVLALDDSTHRYSLQNENKIIGGRLKGRLTTTAKRRKLLLLLMDSFHDLEVKGLADLRLPPLTPTGPILTTVFDDHAQVDQDSLKRLASKQKRTSTAWLKSVSQSIASRESKPKGVAEKIKKELQGKSQKSLRYFSPVDRREILNSVSRQDRGKIVEDGSDEQIPLSTEAQVIGLQVSATNESHRNESSDENAIPASEEISEPRIDLFDDVLDETHSVLSYLYAKQKELDTLS